MYILQTEDPTFMFENDFKYILKCPDKKTLLIEQSLVSFTYL